MSPTVLKLLASVAFWFAGFLTCLALVSAEGHLPQSSPPHPSFAWLYAITNSPWYFGGTAALAALIGLAALFEQPRRQAR